MAVKNVLDLPTFILQTVLNTTSFMLRSNHFLGLKCNTVLEFGRVEYMYSFNTEGLVLSVVREDIN